MPNPLPRLAPEAAHVVMVAESLLGGVRRHLRRVIPALLARGHRIDLVLAMQRAESDVADDLDWFHTHNCRVAIVPMNQSGDLADNMQAWQELRRHFQAWQPDIVHTHATVAGVVGRLAAVRLHPGLIRIHSPHAFISAGYARRSAAHLGSVGLEKLLARITHRYILVSQPELDAAKVITGLPADRLVLAANGLPADFQHLLQARPQARANLGLPLDLPIVGIVGRLAPQKNHAWLFKACAQRQAQHLHIACLGEGSEREQLVQLAAQLGIAQRVHWLGYRARAEQFLRAFDVIALPSNFEGLAYSLLEALAADVPVVASDIAANHPGVEQLDKQISYVVRDDAAGLATALAERSNFAAATSRLTLQHFSLDQQAAQLSACYSCCRKS